MKSVQAGAGAFDYAFCRYGASRSLFRGPARDLSRPYAVFIGGSDTFGRSVPQPYPDLVAQATGLTCVNLGAPNAGPDFYLADPGSLQVAAGAELAVVQLPGVDNLSNAFYTVHSRRNDRFLAATPALRDLYPEVDFADIHFTRHLLTVLADTDCSRFRLVRKALVATWISRMELVLDRLPTRRLLLWIGDHQPDDRGAELGSASAPLFVDKRMLSCLEACGSETVIAVVPPERGTFQAARSTLDPATFCHAADPLRHQSIAAQLSPRIRAVWALRDANSAQRPARATA